MRRGKVIYLDNPDLLYEVQFVVMLDIRYEGIKVFKNVGVKELLIFLTVVTVK